MADLSDLQAAQTIKIAGADAAGVETSYANVYNNQLQVLDISNNGGTQGALTVGTSAVEVKVGGSALTNREFVSIYNNSTAIIYWGYTNAVTTATGTPILKNQERGWPCGAGTTIFVISGTAGNNARVTERA